MKKLAESICEFDLTLMRSSRARDKVRITNILQITSFQTFMIDIYNEAEIAENQTIQSSRTKIGSQKGQAILQDNMDVIKLDNKSFDIDSFAYCKHRFIVPIGKNLVEITRYNKKVAKDHHLKMCEWTNTQANRRGVKPRDKTSSSHNLACMRIQMICLEKTNGSRCYKCEMVCANVLKQGSDIRPFFDIHCQ